MARIRCPVCGRFFESDESRAMPFCSERCKLVDLGRWLDESYSVPCEPKEGDEEMPPEEEE